MSEPHYNAKLTGNDDGTYTLSYGKGKKKLTQPVSRHEAGQKWFIPQGCPACGDGPALIGTLKQIKAAWGIWAEAAYGDADGTPPPSGPPSRKKKVKAEEDAEKLPVIPPGDALVAIEGHEVRHQVATDRFPYLDGYAIIEKATGIQYGWCKQRDAAFESLFERFNRVQQTTQGRVQHPAPPEARGIPGSDAGEDDADPTPAGGSAPAEAPVVDNRPPQDGTLPPIPRRPKPNA